MTFLLKKIEHSSVLSVEVQRKISLSYDTFCVLFCNLENMQTLLLIIKSLFLRSVTRKKVGLGLCPMAKAHVKCLPKLRTFSKVSMSGKSRQ